MENELGGMVAVFVMVFAVILGVFWLFLPLLLLSKLNKLIKVTEESNMLLNVIASHTKPGGAVFPE